MTLGIVKKKIISIKFLMASLKNRHSSKPMKLCTAVIYYCSILIYSIKY